MRGFGRSDAVTHAVQRVDQKAAMIARGSYRPMHVSKIAAIDWSSIGMRSKTAPIRRQLRVRKPGGRGTFML